MSGLSDAFEALKNVVLLHERLTIVRSENEKLSADLAALTAKVQTIDKRVYGIESIIGFARGGGGLPQIEA